MGISYLLFPLDEKMAGWLIEQGHSLPSPLPASRLPTTGELKAVMDDLQGYTAKTVLSASDRSLDIDVVDSRGYDAGWSTSVRASGPEEGNQPSDDVGLTRVTFHKGHPQLAVLITEKLTHTCGPLILVRDMDAKPLLVVEGLGPHAADEW